MFCGMNSKGPKVCAEVNNLITVAGHHCPCV